MDYAGAVSSASVPHPPSFSWLLARMNDEDGASRWLSRGEVRGLATIILDTLDTLDTLDIYTWPSVKGDGRHQAISQDLWAV